MKRLLLGILAALALAAPARAQEEITTNKIYLGGATVTNPGTDAVSIGAGALTAGTFNGSCAGCTSIPAGNLTGTITSGVQDNITRLGTVGTLGGWAVHFLPSTSDTYDLGSPFKQWRQAYIGQMNATLFAKQTQTLYGGWLSVSKNAGTFAAAVASGDLTIDFGQAMTTNDIVLVRAADNTSGAIGEEYVKVGTLSSGTRYNVTRNLSGVGAKAWATGTPYQVRGSTGNGWVEIEAFDSPRLSVFSAGTAYNNQVERLRIGDLTGMPNSASGYGAYIGDSSNYLLANGTTFKVATPNVSIDSNGITTAADTALFASTKAYKWTRTQASLTVPGNACATNSGDEYGVGAFDTSLSSSSEFSEIDLHNTMKGDGVHSCSGRSFVDIAATGWNATSPHVTSAIRLGSDATNPLATQVVIQSGSTSLTVSNYTGLTTASSGIAERGRTTPIGEWTAVAYASGNFTAGNSQTWTVQSGDQTTYAYTLIGKTMTLTATIVTSSIGGTADPELRIAIPGGFSAARAFTAPGFAIKNGGTHENILVTSAAGATYLSLYLLGAPNWPATTDATNIYLTVSFEVQ